MDSVTGKRDNAGVEPALLEAGESAGSIPRREKGIFFITLEAGAFFYYAPKCSLDLGAMHTSEVS